MLRTITPSEMKRVEGRAMLEAGITGEALMQRAAAQVAQAAQRHLSEAPGRVLAVCGTGNNGGDGIAALRMLQAANASLPATLWLLDSSLSPDCSRELARLREALPRLEITRLSAGGPLPSLPSDTACVLDALFGTGLSRDITGPAAALCGLVNAARERGVPVIAVDIPSGLNGETGQVMGAAIRATETVTFHRPKPGLFLGDGPDFAGDVISSGIGIPSALDDAEGFDLVEISDMARFFPARRRVTHKGSYGRALILAGQRGMAGAAAICATAALRTGAGLVTVACPASIVDTVQQLCPCATCLPLPEDNAKAAWEALFPALSKTDALAVGCGFGTHGYARELVTRAARFLEQQNTPAVLDADALNILATEGPFHFSPAQILTPHPAEAARLLGRDVAELTRDAPGAARLLARKYGASIVLKGATSVLISGSREGLHTLGSPALAKGGSGDALTGALIALLANASGGALALSPFEVLQAGCGLHGLAGRAAAKAYGERGALATDVCAYLGRDF